MRAATRKKTGTDPRDAYTMLGTGVVCRLRARQGEKADVWFPFRRLRERRNNDEAVESVRIEPKKAVSLESSGSFRVR